ncbi:hypothetical protein BH24DEI2_BH24DEI2_11000 [soil metagenome]
MPTFTIGEEVMYDDERFVIAAISVDEPVRYRLLATTPSGARMVWANPKDLGKMLNYTQPDDDTARY